MNRYKYAEIDKETSTLTGMGEAPFLPWFPEELPHYCVDITNIDPQPTFGDIYDPETNTFTTPAPPDTWKGYLARLVLTEATGGTFNDDRTEINASVGLPIQVTGTLTDKDGNVVPVNIPLLRVPLIPTDLYGNPLTSLQPELAIASIVGGIVTASWTPEFTGTYAITEEGLNVRLMEDNKLFFDGLQVFVMPSSN